MHNQTDLCMQCPKCRANWYTQSGICPDCGNPNKYLSDGPCVECYKDRKKEVRRVV